MAKTSGGDLECFLSAAVFNCIVRDIIRADVAPLCRGLLGDCCDKVSRMFIIKSCVCEGPLPSQRPE